MLHKQKSSATKVFLECRSMPAYDSLIRHLLLTINGAANLRGSELNDLLDPVSVEIVVYSSGKGTRMACGRFHFRLFWENQLLKS